MKEIPLTMRRYYFIFGEGSKINQVICAILINLPVFSYGASIGWMSPMTLLLQSERSPRGAPLTDAEVSWIAAMPYIVCIPSDFLLERLCNKIGRKKTLILGSVLGLGCWALKLSSAEVWALVAARALVGVTSAAAYVVSPLYTKEVSEDDVRGVLGSLVIFAHTSGSLFLFVIGDVLSYRAVLWTCLSLPAAHVLLFIMMPESPAYLVRRGRLEEAGAALAWLRCRAPSDPSVLREIDHFKLEQMGEDDDEPDSCFIRTILKERHLRRAFTIAMAVTLAREACGAIPVLNFAGEIFARAAEGRAAALAPNRQAMVLGGVQVAGAVLASSAIERAGRKPLLFVSALVSGASMVALASWFAAHAAGAPGPAWVPALTLCVSIFCDAAGLQPLSVVLTSELFTYKYRGGVMALAMACAALASFLQALLFKPLAAAAGVHVAFFFFGGVCLLAALFVALFVPETRSRTVAQIYDDFDHKHKHEHERRTHGNETTPVSP